MTESYLIWPTHTHTHTHTHYIFMYHFQEDGIDLLSIKAVDPAKYALNLMNALFTDEEMGSSCFKKRLGSKTEKPQLSPKRVGLLEGKDNLHSLST